MTMAKVFIGVGHGGKDPGAVGNGLREADLNLAIALACRDELERHGVTVGMSRVTDENDPVGDEAKECNAFMPDIAIEIHCNAGGGDGAEVFCRIDGTGKELAVNILAEIEKIGQNSRGAKTKKNAQGKDSYYFLRNIDCAKVALVECAFIDNAKDIQIIDTPGEQKAMGIAIAKGALATLGIPYKEEKKALYLVYADVCDNATDAEAKKKELQAAGFNAYVTVFE